MKIRRYGIRFTGPELVSVYFVLKNYDPTVIKVDVLAYYMRRAITGVASGFERTKNQVVVSTSRGENLEIGDYVYVTLTINDSAYVDHVEVTGPGVVEDLQGGD